MPSFVNLTINDGAATPVAHTFTGGGPVGTIAKWFDKTAGIISGYLGFTYEAREAKANTNSANRVIMGWTMPTMATIDGVTSRVRLSSAQLSLNFAQDATLQERKDLVAYVTNSMSNATVKQAAIDVESFY